MGIEYPTTECGVESVRGAFDEVFVSIQAIDSKQLNKYNKKCYIGRSW
jgi:hypothetical protein